MNNRSVGELSGKTTGDTLEQRELAPTAMTDEKEKPNDAIVPLIISWRFPEGLSTRYANQMTVQITPTECVLSFFEILPPVLLGSPEENKKTLAEMGSIPANCVARIVVSRERIREFVKTLDKSVLRHLGEGQLSREAQ